MKPLRTYLHATLALLLAFSSIPAWACARTCNDKAGTSLACVRVCAHSAALLTQGGKLDSVGAQACGVQAQVNAESAVLLAQQELQAPQAAFIGVADLPTLSLPQALPMAASTRGPPQPSLSLACQYPTANGPPSLV